jgi:DNA-binding transcriptional LysR family regulator
MTPTDAQLKALVAVADQGSFTHAGRRLGMGQSAVSHAVSGLEEALGVRLLDRSAAGTRLTPVGERIVAHAREVLRLKDQMRREAEAERSLRRGLVRVGSYGPTASWHFLPRILDDLSHRFPEIAVEVTEGSDPEVEQWLRDGSVDVGFVSLPSEEFDTIDLGADEMMVLLPAGHPLATERRIAPRALAALPFIMSSGGCEPAVQELLEGNMLDVRFRIREVQTIVEMVGRGAGVSIKPYRSLPDPLPDSVVLRPLDPPRTRRIGLGVPAPRKRSPAVRAFLRVAGTHRELTGPSSPER